jgi:hypothetical protein
MLPTPLRPNSDFFYLPQILLLLLLYPPLLLPPLAPYSAGHALPGLLLVLLL